LFRDVLLVCEEEGLLGGSFFALDGCKLRSNASKECSGTIHELRRKKGEEDLREVETKEGRLRNYRRKRIVLPDG
jgi:hypothetical protein